MEVGERYNNNINIVKENNLADATSCFYFNGEKTHRRV